MEEEELKKAIEKLRIEAEKQIKIYERTTDFYERKIQSTLCHNVVFKIREKEFELKGFLAGQLAERERCLKMIEELYEKELKEYRVESDGTLTEESGIALGSMMCFKDKLKVELTKKVKEGME